MKLQALGMFRPSEYQPYVLRLKFDGGKSCAIQLNLGQDQHEIAEQLRKLADEVERLRS